jgi:hypothetical protein
MLEPEQEYHIEAWSIFYGNEDIQSSSYKYKNIIK